jgi:hypothetical protein
MKQRHDLHARERYFQPGDQVLALLPIPGRPLQARYFGPYTVDKKISGVNYVINTPDRRKSQQLCHVNMLKQYFERDSSNTHVVSLVTLVPLDIHSDDGIDRDTKNSENSESGSTRLTNAEILEDLDSKLEHLDSLEREQLKQLIYEYKHLFPDIPTRTQKIYHDVDVGDATPIKQHPYRTNPVKHEYLRKEIKYLLDNDFIEKSQSNWSSPCILVSKPDNTFRMCTDYRKVNNVTKSDSFPIPRIEDCIDQIGRAKYVTKFDLLKGFYQVPLTDRTKEISAFGTADGLYQYKVTPFGMKNSPATFQRLMNLLISDIDGIDAYIDDVIIYSDSWEQHLMTIRKFYERLTEANLTVNLDKSEFCHGTVTFLGHVVGQGQVKPALAKIQAISDFLVPACRKQLMRFLGMAGYYRKFCSNFSDISGPLTNLFSKKVKFIWDENSERAFCKIKA